MASDCIAVTLGDDQFCAQKLRNERGTWATGKEQTWPLRPTEAEQIAQEGGEALPAPAGEPPSLGGILEQAFTELGSRTLATAIPTESVVCTIFKLPAAARDDLTDAALLQIDKISPFDDDEHAVSFEVLGETATDLIVFAASAPLQSLALWDGALMDTEGKILRVDVAILAWWRGLLQEGLAAPGRQIALIASSTATDILILDDGIPIITRGIGANPSPEDLTRELLFSCLNAEVDFGSHPVAACTIFTLSPLAPPTLAAIAAGAQIEPKIVSLDSFAACTRGLALRTMEGASLDLTPVHWRSREKEAAQKRKMLIFAAAAGGLWLILAAVLFMGPMVYNRMADRVTRRTDHQKRNYTAVLGLKNRVELIERYTRRERSALNTLRACVADMPQGIILTDLTYNNARGLTLRGTSPDTTEVYQFKNALDATDAYSEVKITQLALDRQKGRQRFSIDATFKGIGTEE